MSFLEAFIDVSLMDLDFERLEHKKDSVLSAKGGTTLQDTDAMKYLKML